MCFSFLSKQSKIEEIRTRQVETAENLIRLQFKMEQLVFCQDQIYGVVLSKIRAETFSAKGTPPQNLKLQSPLLNDLSQISSITEIGLHLNAYFSVSVWAHRSVSWLRGA